MIQLKIKNNVFTYVIFQLFLIAVECKFDALFSKIRDAGYQQATFSISYESVKFTFGG